jgi:hypothetical protein
MSDHKKASMAKPDQAPAPAPKHPRPAEVTPSGNDGLVWENGLLVYRTGSPLPAHVVDDAIQQAREERFKHILGDLS